VGEGAEGSDGTHGTPTIFPAHTKDKNMKLRCPSCGGEHNLSEHFRLQREKGASASERVSPPAKPITTPVTTPVTTKSDVTTKKSTPEEIARVVGWKRANRERYNEYMREYRKSHASPSAGSGT
jgi:hypothetical protein